MKTYSRHQQTSFAYRVFSSLIALVFVVDSVILPSRAYAQSVPYLPVPGTMVPLSAAFHLPVMGGITIDPHDPFLFDFIIYPGDGHPGNQDLQEESMKLIKYFMAALTVPEDELWVNLSPYEKNRMIPANFGRTGMGRDLLAQDYLLKQLTASLLYPENETGREFWERVHRKIYERFGAADIPTDTFQKIWIVPDRAVVYEHAHGAVIVESRLKVMLEEDYLALEQNRGSVQHGLGDVSEDDLTKMSDLHLQIFREVLIPEIEKEVNEGRNFAALRQIYNAVILATWYKQALKDGILNRVYADRNKTEGIAVRDMEENRKIYERYLEAFKKGVYNYIREDYDPHTREIVPRKYFSGGAVLKTPVETKHGLTAAAGSALRAKAAGAVVVRARVDAVPAASSPIKAFDKDVLKNDFLARLIRYESMTYDPAADVRLAVIEGRAEIYREMVKAGLMTREALEDYLKDKNSYVRLAVSKVLFDLTMEQIERGEPVDLTAFLGMANDNIDTNVEWTLEGAGDLSVALIGRGKKGVDPDFFDRHLNGARNRKRVNAAQAKAKIFAAMVRAGTMSLPQLEQELETRNPEWQEAVQAQIDALTAKPAGDDSPAADVRPSKAELINELKSDNADVRKAAIPGLYEILKEEIQETGTADLSPFESMLDSDIMAERVLAPALASLYALEVRAGTKSLQDFEKFRYRRNDSFTAAVIEELGRLYIEMIRRGERPQWTILEQGPIEQQEKFYSSRAAVDALTEVYKTAVFSGQLSLEELTGKLDTENDGLYSAVFQAIAGIYKEMIAQGRGNEVRLEILAGQIPGWNQRMYATTFIKALGGLYLDAINDKQAVDLTAFESLLSHKNSIHRREAAHYIGMLYAALVRNGQYTAVNRRAYEFWHRNGLFFDEPDVNTVMLSHFFQSNTGELEADQRQIDQITKDVAPFTDNKNIISIVFYLEKIIPDSSVYALDLLQKGRAERLLKYWPMFAHSEIQETLMYAQKHFLHAEMRDYFILMDYLSIFTFLGSPGYVRRQFDRPYNSRSHFYKLLNTGIMESVQGVNAQNPANMKSGYLREVFELSEERIKPYVLQAGLRSGDRFSQRFAAKQAKKIRVVTDALRDDLIATLNDKRMSVVEYAADSLKEIGDERSLVLLYEFLMGAPERVVLHIYNDHSQIEAYTEPNTDWGDTFDDFFSVGRELADNPKIPVVKDTILAIESRIERRRSKKKIEIAKIKDKRLVKFFAFLKKHGLEKDIVVIGGGVRDAYAGKSLNDIDVSIRIPLTRQEHIDLLPTRMVANKRIYDYAMEKLSLLADVLGVDVNDFLPPVGETPVVWEGIEIQYAGPILLKAKDGGSGEEREVYLKRNVVGADGWYYSSSTGASLLKMAMDSDGTLYGRVDALDEFEKGYLRIAGNRDNLTLDDILRIIILKYQFQLYIFQEDYEIIEQTIQKYRDDLLQLPKGVPREITIRQLKKVLIRAHDSHQAYDELKKLGILSLVKDKLDIDLEPSSPQASSPVDTKGGIDLNPNGLDLEVTGGNEGFPMPAVQAGTMERFWGVAGFSPRIIQIVPLGNTPFPAAGTPALSNL